MNIINKIGIKAGEYQLSRRLKKMHRNQRMHNFDTARTIGIIFNATQLENFTHVKEFLNTLRDKDLEIYAIGYVDKKEIDDQLVIRKNFNFFCRTDLAWNYLPTAPFVNELIDKKLDILIDLSITPHFALQYMAALSKASFKIGVYTPEKEKQRIYDLMLDISKQPDISYLIEQVKYYLNMIHVDSRKEFITLNTNKS
ncbi:MAG TPA: hypothetical protein VE912_17335 [Bacteroidales bacterium]|nr:hypothetical protein [Bacteroidales bacterium]